MREILFRGKRVDNGEWVEGLLSYDNDGKISRIEKRWNEHITNHWIIEVIPDTIGEYTGLTDKNSTRIFGGDIVRNSVGAVYVIKWDTESLAFVFSCFKCETGKEVSRPLVVTYEVIGNIYDNPELLEGGENNG